jgi:aryl-alcohol dehydrogenase-like predicted oxidoreductase
VQTTTLGPLTVSRLALGAMLMGGKTPPDEAERILDRYLAAGGNFIDTADVYENGGSERVLAPWLARHRSEVVVATKVRFEVSDPGGAERAVSSAAVATLAVTVMTVVAAPRSRTTGWQLAHLQWTPADPTHDKGSHDD